jgi:hypothetical protein
MTTSAPASIGRVGDLDMVVEDILEQVAEQHVGLL